MGNFLESVRAFIADNPLLQTGLDMGSIIVPFALLYAYFGLTFSAMMSHKRPPSSMSQPSSMLRQASCRAHLL